MAALLPVVLLLPLLLASLSQAAPGDKPSFLFILGDDIGWADFGYNGGTAHTPNLNALAKANGSILLNDFHSGGTVSVDVVILLVVVVVC